MNYNVNSRCPPTLDARLWLVLAILALSVGLTIAGYTFSMFLNISPAGIQIQIEGKPNRKSLLPAPLIEHQIN